MANSNRPKARKLLNVALQVALVLAVVYFLSESLLEGWQAARSVIEQLHWQLGVAILLFAAAVPVSGMFWGSMLNELSPEKIVGKAESIRIQIVSWLLKYIPGQAGSLLSKVAWARKNSVSQRRVVASILYENVFLISSSLLLSVPVLGLTIVQELGADRGLVIPLIMTLLVLPLLIPRVFSAAMSLGLRLIRKKSLAPEHLLGNRQVARFQLAFLLPRIINAVGFVAIASIFIDASLAEQLQLGGTYILAGVIGILALFVPSGLGVREAVIVIAASPILGVETAAATAILARICAVSADVSLALVYGVMNIFKIKASKAKPQIPTVSISAAPFSGNQGAASMLHATIQQLRAIDKNLRIVVFTVYPESDRRLNPYDNVEIYPATPLGLVTVLIPLSLVYKLLPPLRPILGKINGISELAASKVQIDLAGISFADGRAVFLIYNIASILPAFILGVPIVKFAQAMGPFKSTINKVVSKLALRRMDQVFARGQATSQALQRLKLGNVTDASDIAFLFEPRQEDQASIARLMKENSLDTGKFILVAPSVVLMKKAAKQGLPYIEMMAEYVGWLVREYQQPVVLLSHSVREGTDKLHNNDLPVAKKIYELIKPTQPTHLDARPDFSASNGRSRTSSTAIGVAEQKIRAGAKNTSGVSSSAREQAGVVRRLWPKSNCILLDKPLYAGELKTLIGESRFLIAARFHAMISALATGTPVGVTGWSHKYQEVLDAFGLELPVAYLDKDFLSNIKSLTNQVAESEQVIRDKLTAGLPKVKQQSKVQVEYVKKIL